MHGQGLAKHAFDQSITAALSTGLSVKPGGSVREIDIAGGIKTNGAGVAPIEQHGAICDLRCYSDWCPGRSWTHTPA